jgi:hypothetical protein
MALIEFKDYPNTSTPLNAENLNNNFNELKEKIEKLNYIVATISNKVTATGMGVITLDKVSDKEGEKLKLENGGIKIGSGVSKIRVSGSVFVNISTQSAGYLWTQIRKNGASKCSSLTPVVAGMGFVSASVPSMIIDVVENDVIDLMGDFAGPSGEIRNNAENTWLLVEVIK